MPKELLSDVAWSFAQKRFSSLPEFAEALAEYNAEIFEKPFTDVWTNKLQLVGNRILIQYEYWNDEEEDIIEQIMLQADNNKYLTYSSFCRMESSLTTDIHWCSQQFKRFRDISTFEIVQ